MISLAVSLGVALTICLGFILPFLRNSRLVPGTKLLVTGRRKSRIEAIDAEGEWHLLKPCDFIDAEEARTVTTGDQLIVAHSGLVWRDGRGIRTLIQELDSIRSFRARRHS